MFTECEETLDWQWFLPYSARNSGILLFTNHLGQWKLDREIPY